MECDALTAICDAAGEKVLDVGSYGGRIILGIPGVERVACVEMDDLMKALQTVGILDIEEEYEQTVWRGDYEQN